MRLELAFCKGDSEPELAACGCRPAAEWYFRSSLDRYVWIHGMLCAFLKPWAEGALHRIDAMQPRARFVARGLLLAGARL